MGYDETIVFQEDWAVKLQERLSEPNKWKDICRVDYTDTQVLHNPYLTDPQVGSLSRGTPYTMRPITETDESVTITNAKYTASFIDRASLAQSTYLKQMDLADVQGVLLNEAIESAVYADYGNMTTFDQSVLVSGGTGSITVSDTNIDDIITAILREISEANGDALLERNGGFIVWRPADFEILTRFMMANGFSTADNALKGGVKGGVDYMGLTHYKSNKLTALHNIAGVKKVYHLGICKSTYGQIVVNDKDPGLTSGISVTSRVDYAGKVWTKVKPVLFNMVVV